MIIQTKSQGIGRNDGLKREKTEKIANRASALLCHIHYSYLDINLTNCKYLTNILPKYLLIRTQNTTFARIKVDKITFTTNINTQIFNLSTS